MHRTMHNTALSFVALIAVSFVVSTQAISTYVNSITANYANIIFNNVSIYKELIPLINYYYHDSASTNIRDGFNDGVFNDGVFNDVTLDYYYNVLDYCYNVLDYTLIQYSVYDDVLNYNIPYYTLNIPILGLCIYINLYVFIDIVKMFVWYFAMYGITMYISISNKVTINASVYVSNSLSMVMCWIYLLYNATYDLKNYYIFGLVLCLYNKDWLMCLHHIGTLYCLNICHDSPDYNNLHDAIYLLKIGDIFIHQYKIVDALNIYKLYPIGVRVYQFITTIITAFLWLICRCILPFGLYPFHDRNILIVAVIFHIANFIWTYKLFRLAYKTYSKIAILRVKADSSDADYDSSSSDIDLEDDNDADDDSSNDNDAEDSGDTIADAKDANVKGDTNADANNTIRIKTD